MASADLGCHPGRNYLDSKLEKRKALIYELISSKEYRPMKTKEIAALLQIPRSQRVELQQVLDELMNEGKIGFNKKGQYKRKKSVFCPKTGITPEPLQLTPKDLALWSWRAKRRTCIFRRKML